MAEIDTSNIFDEVPLKNGFMLNYHKTQEHAFSKNKVYRIKDAHKTCLICMDMEIYESTWKDERKGFKDTLFVCLGRALKNTTKWNMKHILGDKLITI